MATRSATGTRRLPIPSTQHEFTVKVAGEAMPRSTHLLGVSVRSSANRISSARLVYQDGAAASGDFPLSSADTLVPGAEIEILAGAGNDASVLFKGVITRHSLKIREATSPQLVIECRHAAMRMSIARKNAYYYDQRDSEVITQLLETAGLEAEVEPTAVTHPQQVQYDATDWDYLLLRAEANGLLVFTGNDQVSARTPRLDGEPAFTLQFGSTILEADLQLDARHQYTAVKVRSWDPANQELLDVDASNPALTQPGNLDHASLAAAVGLDAVVHTHPALAQDEAQHWADAQWRYSQANRVCGSIKCEGIGAITPGSLVQLDGVGARFNGKALVTGVRHEFDLVQGWKTWLQFGGLDPLAGQASGIQAPPAKGLLPAVQGLQIGVVVGNQDPAREFRVRVTMPLVDGGDEGTWARVACLDAGDERGYVFRPEVGDEVVIGFLGDDPRHAVVLGMLHSSAKPAPLQPDDANHIKLYQSRAGLQMRYDDDKVAISLTTPAGNRLSLSEDDGGITLQDQNDNLIQLNAAGITLESATALTLKAGTDIKFEAGSDFGIAGGAVVVIEGSAGVEVKSSAITTIKGSLVQIN
jgi:Rhs element Vgr protein